MRAAQDGDRVAYATLLTEVAAVVRNFVRRRLADTDAQEEVVQDTLLAIHRDRHTYDPARPFRPWMFAIARHRLLDHFDKQRRRSRIEVLAEVQAEAEDPASSDAGARDRRAPGLLRHALAQLSRTQREIIEMLKLDGLSVAEISTRTGMTASTVKVTAHRGYKRLRALIGDDR
jgi:RNA polymerase sigma-70 factor (ECF subfamily)